MLAPWEGCCNKSSSYKEQQNRHVDTVKWRILERNALAIIPDVQKGKCQVLPVRNCFIFVLMTSAKTW